MTKTEIEDYIDAVIKHSLSMVEYSNYFLVQIKGFAEDTQDKCNKILLKHVRSVTKKQKNECETEIEEVLSEFQNQVEEFIAKQLQGISEIEIDYLQNVVGKSLGVNFVVPATAVGILSLVPITSIGNAKDFGAYTSDKLGKIYNSVLNQSQIFEEDYEDVLSEYESQFNAFERGLNAEAGTLGYSLGEEFERIVFTKTDNPKVKYMWSAILDTTTCLACGMLDHKIYDKIEDVPMYPLHFSCRCTLVCGNEEIFEQYPESYQKWFERQPEKTKYDILKRTRYSLYKQGMKITQFVNNNTVTPLKALKPYPSMAKTLFPKEKWNKVDNNVYVAESRTPVNKNQKEVFDKEINMAKIASKYGHTSYLLPEKGDGKHPDTLFDNVLTDFKKVSGNIKTIGKRFAEGMKQADQVFMQIDSKYTIQEIKNKLQGEVIANKLKAGKVFIYLDGNFYE